MHSPSCLLLATHCPGSPQDTCGPSSPPHMDYCLASLVRIPSSLLDWSFFQDSVHGGAPSGIQALFRKWVLLGNHWPRLYHVALCSSGTWISHLCTQSYEELVEGCGTSSGLDFIMGKQGATRMSPGGWVVDHNRKTYIRPLVSQRKIILPLFYIYTHIFWSISKPVF